MGMWGDKLYWTGFFSKPSDNNLDSAKAPASNTAYGVANEVITAHIMPQTRHLVDDDSRALFEYFTAAHRAKVEGWLNWALLGVTDALH